jgi:hypothetical protein
MENTVQEQVAQPKEPKKKGSTTGVLVGILTFLVLLLATVAVVAFTDLEETILDIDTAQDTSIDEQEDNLVEEVEEDVEVVTVDNEGWGLYTAPEYGFSVEVPTYKLEQEFGPEDEDLVSYWEVSQSDESFVGDLSRYWFGKINDELLTNIDVKFFPTRIPESAACGQGCLSEHSITVFVFDDNRTYEEVKEEYVLALTEVDNEETRGAEFEEMTKWGYETLSFRVISPGGESSGYVLNNGEETYHINYYLNETPEESFEVAQKVIDSMKFE